MRVSLPPDGPKLAPPPPPEVAAAITQQTNQGNSLHELFPVCGTGTAYIITDASPLWSSGEMFASTLDALHFHDNPGSGWNRQLLPPLKIGRSHLCLRGKQYALLWQLHLVGAATFEDLVRLTGQVISVTSDFGTERMLAEAGDVVIPFCKANGIPVPPGATARERTFPIALVCPGVQHMLDNLLRRWCSSMPWFAEWLRRTKALLKLLREYSVDLTRALKKQNLHGAVEVVQSAAAPYFAAWRWNTLFAATRCVRSMWTILAEHWKRFGFVKSIDDHALARCCQEALTDKSFPVLADAVLCISGKFADMSGWVSGCACHRESRANKRNSYSTSKYKQSESSYVASIGPAVRCQRHHFALNRPTRAIPARMAPWVGKAGSNHCGSC